MDSFLSSMAKKAEASKFSELNLVEQAYVMHLYFCNFPDTLRKFFSFLGVEEEMEKRSGKSFDDMKMPSNDQEFADMFGTTKTDLWVMRGSKVFCEAFVELNEYNSKGLKKKAMLLENEVHDALMDLIKKGDRNAIIYYHKAYLGMNETTKVEVNAPVGEAGDPEEIANKIVSIFKKNKINVGNILPTDGMVDGVKVLNIETGKEEIVSDGTEEVIEKVVLEEGGADSLEGVPAPSSIENAEDEVVEDLGLEEGERRADEGLDNIFKKDINYGEAGDLVEENVTQNDTITEEPEFDNEGNRIPKEPEVV